MRRQSSALGLVLLLGACQPSVEPVAIGSALSPRLPPSVLAVVRDAIDSLAGPVPIALDDWSLMGFGMSLHSSQAERFAGDPAVVAVVGHGGSRDALLGAAVYNREGVSQVVPNATSGELLRAGPWTFMLAPNDSVEGAFLARWAVDSAVASRIVVMYLGDEYGIGLLGGVKKEMAGMGREVVDEVLVPGLACTPAPDSLNQDVFSALARATIQRSRPDAIILAGADFNGWCLVHSLHTEARDLWVIAADGFDVSHRPDTPTAAYNPERLRSASFWVPTADSASRAFVDRFRRVTGQEPRAGMAMEFDAFMLLHDAIQAVGRDRRAVRRWLESLGRDRPPWRGVTGLVTFDRPRAEILRMVAPPAGRE